MSILCTVPDIIVNVCSQKSSLHLNSWSSKQLNCSWYEAKCCKFSLWRRLQWITIIPKCTLLHCSNLRKPRPGKMPALIAGSGEKEAAGRKRGCIWWPNNEIHIRSAQQRFIWYICRLYWILGLGKSIGKPSYKTLKIANRKHWSKINISNNKIPNLSLFTYILSIVVFIDFLSF